MIRGSGFCQLLLTFGCLGFLSHGFSWVPKGASHGIPGLLGGSPMGPLSFTRAPSFRIPGFPGGDPPMGSRDLSVPWGPPPMKSLGFPRIPCVPKGPKHARMLACLHACVLARFHTWVVACMRTGTFEPHMRAAHICAQRSRRCLRAFWLRPQRSARPRS